MISQANPTSLVDYDLQRQKNIIYLVHLRNGEIKFTVDYWICLLELHGTTVHSQTAKHHDHAVCYSS